MKKAFTIIELIILVAIICILGAIAIPKFYDIIRKSHAAAHPESLPKETKLAKVENSIKDYKVERLFTVDGCTIYRFSEWDTHYFASCKGAIFSRVDCGKDCTREENIPTSVEGK